MTAFEIFELGDHALVATAVDAVSFETQQRVWWIAQSARDWPHVEEVIPGMNNLTLVFDPLVTDLAALRSALEAACADSDAQVDATLSVAASGDTAADEGGEVRAVRSRRKVPDAPADTGSSTMTLAKTVSRPVATPGRDGGRLIELPVRYGGSEGPDLEAVARHAHLSVSEVIERHSAPEYVVFFIGFQPGFAYLGGLDPTLVTPRRKEPRVQVPAGSVGIGGAQTGVYPMASPGGWQLIGRTAEVLFDPARAAPALFEPGDRVRFVPVGEVR